VNLDLSANILVIGFKCEELSISHVCNSYMSSLLPAVCADLKLGLFGIFWSIKIMQETSGNVHLRHFDACVKHISKDISIIVHENMPYFYRSTTGVRWWFRMIMYSKVVFCRWQYPNCTVLQQLLYLTVACL